MTKSKRKIVSIIDPYFISEKCGYCLGGCGSKDLKFVQLSHNATLKNSWQHPKLISKECRTFLNGFYRNVKIGVPFWCAGHEQNEVVMK